MLHSQHCKNVSEVFLVDMKRDDVRRPQQDVLCLVSGPVVVVQCMEKYVVHGLVNSAHFPRNFRVLMHRESDVLS